MKKMQVMVLVWGGGIILSFSFHSLASDWKVEIQVQPQSKSVIIIQYKFQCIDITRHCTTVRNSDDKAIPLRWAHTQICILSTTAASFDQ